MSIASNFPAIKPTLLLDFSNTKELDPRITFTRASTATYYGTQTAKAEQNLFVSSSNLASANWPSGAAGTAVAVTKTENYAPAPDGTTTAARYEMSLNGGTSTADLCSVLQSYTTGVATEVTYSVWIKSTDGVSTYAAQIISPTAAGVAVSITGIWTRFVVTATSLATVVSYGLRLRGGQSPTNSDTADILIWGAQLEQRDAVTAYTVTTTQPITNYIPQLLTAASGVARFDHNPTTFESLGLEIEEQRANLLTYSEQFDNAAWTKSNATITANTVVAPDGTLTGDKLVENTATSTHEVQQNQTVTVAPHTFSAYAKAGERNWLRLLAFQSGLTGVIAFFNLSTGAIGTVGPSATARITPVGNGWYRCSITYTPVSAATCAHVVYVATADNTVTYTGDGFSGIYIWGAQLEAGAFATSYIPTVASQVTRAADAAIMTGTNFSSWYSQGQGTLYAEFNPLALAASSGVVINDNTTSNRIRLATTSVSDQGTVTTSGTAQAVLDGGTPAANTSMKLAMTYQVNNFALSLNGATAATDTTGTVPVVSQLQIGSETTTVGNLTIKKIAYYPIASTATQLQGLTS
jgi:hypothetical protein